MLPEQKKKIQLFFEDMTLSVSEVDLTRLSSNMGDPAVQATCTIVTYTQFVFMSMIGFVLYIVIFWTLGLRFSEAFKTLLFVQSLLSLATMVVAWRWPLPGIVRWIVGRGRRSFVIARWLLILFVAALISNANLQIVPLFLGQAFSMDTAELRIHSWPSIILIFLVSPLLTLLWIATNCVGTMLWPRSTRRSFALTRATLWRVVEYERGAVAAVVLAVTIMLGLIKALMEVN